LCDALIEAGPDAATLCAGWRTKDLAAHLFVRERRPLAAPGIVFAPFAKLTDISMDAALRSHGFAGLVERIRSGPPLAVRPIDEVINRLEFFVHTEDVLRASPNWEPRVDPQLDEALWASLARAGRMLARGLRGAGLDLERPDGERIVARAAEPRAVLSGGPQELVLCLYGRGEMARVTLGGSEEAQGAVRRAFFNA